MNLKLAIAAVGVVAIGLPLAVLANQPPVKVTRLAMTPAEQSALRVLLVDPGAPVEFSIRQVRGFATLDVDADPFAAAR